jgi:predicted DNA-binding transcriptional regulator YafY
MSLSSTFEKYKIILDEFHAQKILDAYNPILQEKLNLSYKQIDRLLADLQRSYDNIILLEGKRRKTYELIKPIDIFIESFKNSEEISWYFQMAQEADPEVFDALEKFTKKEKHIYMFKNTPFEDVSTFESKKIFKRLKKAVKYREYVKIKNKYDDKEYDNLKALKLIFIDNNWYFAFVSSDDILRLARLSFIERVDFATKENFFQPSSVEKYIRFLKDNLQNSMTIYTKETKTALLKASPYISRYFEKDMKKFFQTQEFKEKLEDGSILFSIKYTQSLEILPFVQKWLPDIEILEPKKLKTAYKEKLKKVIERIKG